MTPHRSVLWAVFWGNFLALGINLGQGNILSSWADLTINGGETLNVVSTPSTWYTYSTPGTITINGTLRGIERTALTNGAITGNGGSVNLSGGLIIIGNTGRINLDATQNNGNGGRLILSGPTITNNGIISANGLGTGRAGTIDVFANTFDMGSTGRIVAQGNSALGGLGGVIRIHATGAVNLASGSQLVTNGATQVTSGQVSQNLITIEGAGVNIAGNITADGTGASRAGRIEIANATTGDINIASSSIVQARSGANSGTGGDIVISNTAGNIQINGQINAIGNAGGNGGTVTITAANDFTTDGSSGGALRAVSAGVGVNTGNGGSIIVTAGRDISLNSSSVSTMVNADGAIGATSFSSNPAGNGGSIAFNAGRDITISSNSISSNNALIHANGAVGDTPGNGGSISFSGRNLTITSDNAQPIRTMLQASGGNGRAGTTGNGGTISSNLSGNINLNRSRLLAHAGANDTGYTGTKDGTAGTIDLSLAGDYNSTNSVLFSNASGNGGGGLLRVRSSGGNITLDGDSYVQNLTNGSGIVTIEGMTITNNGTLASQGLNNPSSGGTVNITAQNTFSNTGNVTASAYTRSLDTLSTTANATGHGGKVNITATDIVHNGVAGSAAGLKRGQITAYGGLNTQGSPQGNGGVINITASNSFSMDQNATIDSRGNTVLNSRLPGSPIIRNRINLTAGTATINGRINASGFYAGASGGVINLSTTTGDLALGSSSLISTSGGLGDVFNNNGNGGKTVLNAEQGNLILNGKVESVGTGNNAGGRIELYSPNGTITLNDTAQVNASSGSTTENGGTIIAGGQNITLNSTSASQPLLLSTGNNQWISKTEGYGSTIELNADKDLTINSSAASSTVPVISSANIVLNGNNVILNNTHTSPRLMLSTTRLPGQTGTIELNAQADISATNSIMASQGTSAGFAGGRILLNAAGGNIGLHNSQIKAQGTQANGGQVTLSAGGALYTDTASEINTSGWATDTGDTSANRISLTAESLDLNGSLTANGDMTTGGNGGQVTLTSTSGNIGLSGLLQAKGYVLSNAFEGNGGTVTIQAAGGYSQSQNGQIIANSHALNAVQGLNSQNNGGNVSVNTGGDLQILYQNLTSIQTQGASYGIGSNLTGGHGGQVTLRAEGLLQLSDLRGDDAMSTPTYIDAQGGIGHSSGFRGGNGGNVTIYALGGSIIDNYASISINTAGGAGYNNAITGNNGNKTLNDWLLP